MTTKDDCTMIISITIPSVASLIASTLEITYEEALKSYRDSNSCRDLCNEETKLWKENSHYLANEFFLEKNIYLK